MQHREHNLPGSHLALSSEMRSGTKKGQREKKVDLTGGNSGLVRSLPAMAKPCLGGRVPRGVLTTWASGAAKEPQGNVPVDDTGLNGEGMNRNGDRSGNCLSKKGSRDVMVLPPPSSSRV